MNIAIVSNVSRGLYSFRCELIEKLAKSHNVTILAKESIRVEDFKRMGCSFIGVQMEDHGTNPVKELELISTYKKIFKQIKPDIVLTYTIKPNIYAGMVCASMKIPYIANITGLGTAVEDSRGIKQKSMLFLYKHGLRKAKKVFFQNETNMRFMLEKGIVKCNNELIPGSGVNLERYGCLEYPHGDTVDFTYIGRLVKQKGIDIFTEMAKTIRERHPETRFHVCGTGEQKYIDLMNKLNDEGVIIYHGLIDDIAGMHAVSCCTVHPTYYPEGMSNVLLESCACGRPIITTDRPGCREIVDVGVNGFTVREKDVNDLIEKVEAFLTLGWEERRDMGLAGRAKVEKEFDRNIVILKYFEAIEG